MFNAISTTTGNRSLGVQTTVQTKGTSQYTLFFIRTYFKPGVHMICNGRRRSTARGRQRSPIVTDHMGTLDTASATVGDERFG